MAKKTYRPDQKGTHEREYKKNRKKLIKSKDVCAICGLPIDKSLKFPNPMSASADHIIAVSNGGHPSSMENLQLTHLICNQLKGTKATIEANKGLAQRETTLSNRILPQSINWSEYRAKK